MAEPKATTGSVPTQGFSTQETGTSTLDKANREEAGQMQFPSLAGQPNVEVAERSADVSRGSSKVHRKVFRVFTAGLEFDAASFDHQPNFTATRQYMIDHGLRPLGDVSFVGAEAYDGKNTDLTYQVEAVPAAIDDTADITVPQDRPAA